MGVVQETNLVVDTVCALGGRLFTKNREEAVAIAIQLCLPDTTDTQHLRGGLWSIRKHLVQSLVMENDIRRHIVLTRHRLPARS